MGIRRTNRIYLITALVLIILLVATGAANAANSSATGLHQPAPTPTIWPTATPTPDPEGESGYMPYTASSSYIGPILGRGIDPTTFAATFFNGPRISGTNFTKAYTEPIDWIRPCFDPPDPPHEACELDTQLDDGGNYGVRWQADLIVPMDGTYTFAVENVDDGVMLFVNNVFTVDTGWNFPAPDTIGPQNTIALTAGTHELRIDYFQGVPFAASLRVLWAGPGFDFEVIPLFDPYDCTVPQSQLSAAAEAVQSVVPSQNFCNHNFEELVIIPTDRSGKAAFELFAELARDARSEVNFTTMSWHFDETPSQLILDSPGEIFLDGVRQLYLKVLTQQENYPLGMKVRILLGLEHYSYNAGGDDLRTAVLQNLRDLGVPLLDVPFGWELQVAAYRDSESAIEQGGIPSEAVDSHHSHAKLLVVDNATVMSVGYNMEHLYLDASEFPAGTDLPWHDMGLRITGPVAKDAAQAFNDLWDLGRGLCQPPASSTFFLVPNDLGTCIEYLNLPVPPVAGFVATGHDNAFSLFRRAPFENDLSDQGISEADDAIVAAIIAAETEANIIRPRLEEFGSGAQLLPYSNAIKEAIVQNDAVVRLLVSAFPVDTIFNLQGVRLLHQELRTLGLHEKFQPRAASDIPFPSGVHSKALSVDGDILIVGSHNFDSGSWPPPNDLLSHDLAEHSIAVDNATAIQEFDTYFFDRWNQGSEFFAMSFFEEIEEFTDDAFNDIGFLLPGIYEGDLFINNPNKLIGAGPQETIIDCGGQGIGLSIVESDVLISNLWIRNCDIGIELVDESPATLENVQISQVVFEDNTFHIGIVGEEPGSPVSFSIENNTFVGGFIGVELALDEDQPGPSLVRNNIFQDVAFPISILQSDGSNTEYSFNLFNGCEFNDCSANWIDGALGAGSSAHDNIFDVAPEFEDQFSSDFRLGFASPAIDAGDPAFLALFPGMEGYRVIFEGDGVGDLSIDIGAFEAEIPEANKFPFADAGGPYFASEGDLVLLSASASEDADNDDLTYTWDFDRDLIWDIVNSTDPDTTYAWADDFSGQAIVKVDDTFGHFDEDFAEVEISNVAPTVDAGADVQATVGEEVDFAGSFTDPGIDDTHTIEWDFGGDGTATGTLTPTHTFTSPGTFLVTLTITDDDGDDGDDELIVEVPGAAAVFLVIDEDGISAGSAPNFFSGDDVNAAIAEIGARTQLPFFAQNVDNTITLHSGEVGDEGWFAIKTIPMEWQAAGPATNGLRNFVGELSQPFPHNVGPGLGTPDADGDREALLAGVPNVTPLRATGLKLLEGQRVCAVVRAGDVSINYGPQTGSLKGATFGTVAFEVLSVTQLIGGSSSALPEVGLRILDADTVCEGQLDLLADAPELFSASEPVDVEP